MKRLFPLFCFLGALLASGGLSHALTIPASEDTSGGTQGITNASNAANSLSVDAKNKAYLYFNLNDIPSTAVVRWAKLRLFLPTVASKGAGLSIYRVTGTWDEAKASATPAIASGTLATIPADQLGSKRFVTADVTSTVQQWITGKVSNEGFAVGVTTGKETALVTLTSKEGILNGLPAELDIDFKPESEPVALEQLPSAVRSLLSPKPITLDSLSEPVKALLTSGSITVDRLPEPVKALTTGTIASNRLPDLIQQYFSPTFNSDPSILISEGVIRGDVKGIGSMSYQWFKNGVRVAGGTGSTLSLAGLTTGTYTLRASNGFAAVTSRGVPFDLWSPDPVTAFVPIPAGIYQLGNLPIDEESYFSPVRTVTISAFQMAVTPTTKAQWDLVRSWGGNHGYNDLVEGDGKDTNHPVVRVSWYDVVKWANAASEKDRLKPCYKVIRYSGDTGEVYRTGMSYSVTCDWSASGYRLPTEAEWEVAARGGLIGKRFPWGDTISQSQANYRTDPSLLYDLSGTVNGYFNGGDHPTWGTGDYPYTSPVGSFARNGYNLYDMAGNVFQWCWDWRDVNPTAGSNPKGPDTGTSRILRGGSFERKAYWLMVSARNTYQPDGSNECSGFRLARKAGL